MVVSRFVAENEFFTGQQPVLLINQPDIEVKACALGRARAHVIGPSENGAISYIWGPAGSIWVCQDQGVRVYLDQGHPMQH